MSKQNSMKSVLAGAAIASALAGLLAPGVVLAEKTDKAGGAVHCNAGNDCKGKGSCSSASNDCKGMNACKGKSWTMTKSAKECTAKGGTVAQADTKK
jgi:hypothetical protein